MGAGHSHSHAVATGGNERALWWALGLTTSFMIVEVIGGIMANSLALISDAAHMFTDTAALGISLAAIHVGKRAADQQRTYGYYRFEILAATLNALLLFAVAVYILYEAYQRFRNPPEIQAGAMLYIAVAGLMVNLVSMRLLSSGKDSSLNVKGAYLEVWSDMLGSLGVIVGALVIRFAGWWWVDPVIALAIGLWVLPRTWILLKSSLNILLEGVPEGMQLSKVEQGLLSVPGVSSVHDLHVWSLTSGKPSLTAHVVHATNENPAELLEKMKEVLAKRFDLFHTTLQLELTPCEHTADGCNFVPRQEHEHSHEMHSHETH